MFFENCLSNYIFLHETLLKMNFCTFALLESCFVQFGIMYCKAYHSFRDHRTLWNQKAGFRFIYASNLLLSTINKSLESSRIFIKIATIISPC